MEGSNIIENEQKELSLEEIIEIKNKLQDDAVDAWYNNNCVGTLNLYTGAGKTFCFFKALYKVWPKGDKLSDVWFCSETLAREYDVRVEAEKFGMIYGKNPLEDFNIRFEIYQSVHKLKNESISFVCLDEIQDCITPVRINFLKNNYFKMKLGLTATPGIEKVVVPNPKITKGQYYNKYCPIIYSYHTIDAVDEGIYSKIKIDVLFMDLDKTNKYKLFKNGNPCTEMAYYSYFDRKYMTEFGKNRMFAAMKRSSCLSDMPGRIKKAKMLVDLYEANNKKTVIIGNSLDALSQITSNVVQSRPAKEKYINEELRYKFDNNLIKTLGSFKILQQGANLNSMHNLILYSHFKDEDKFLQRLGRARLGKDTTRITIFCFRDTVEQNNVELFIRPFKNVSLYDNFEEYYEKRNTEITTAP